MLRVLGIVVSSLCVCFGFFSGVSAQTDRERLVITTYYPSPYGSYNELRSKRMVIGDGYISNTAWGWSGAANTFSAESDLLVEGRVGIGNGVIAPDAYLQVTNPANMTVSPVVHIVNARNLAAQNGLLVDVANTETSTYALNVQTNTASRLYVRADGNVGVGNSAPSEKLVVAGGVTVGSTTGSNQGTLRYATGVLSVYNTTGWEPILNNTFAGMSVGTGAGAACTIPNQYTGDCNTCPDGFTHVTLGYVVDSTGGNTTKLNFCKRN